MKADHARTIPPGLSFQKERNIFCLCLAGVSLLSIILFCRQYFTARQALFIYSYGRKVLLPDAVIAPFTPMLYHVFDPLIILLLALPFWGISHYLYFRQGSMSIYLMRRLPDQRLLGQQCWTLPLLGLLLCMLTVGLLLGLYVLIYRCATPAQCLPW